MEKSPTWSKPELIFQGFGSISTPIIIADKYGYVHIFWRYEFSESSSEDTFLQIYYSRWDGENWSKPVDMVASESVLSISAIVDLNGVIDLIWVSTGNDLLFSQVNVEDAINIKNWSKPTILVQSGQYPQITNDLQGNLYIIYPDNDFGISYLTSIDGGKSWSASSSISPSSNENSAASTPYLALSENGIIHAVWTESLLPDGWPPIGVFYSRSLDDGETWSEPIKMAGEGYDQINIATGQDDVVHLAWNGMVGVFGRYHCWSTNGGESWTTIEIITESGATEGPPKMVIDKSGILHILTTYNGGAWYHQWNNQQWNTPLLLSKNESTDWLEEGSLSINRGNTLHAVYWADRQRLWYTSTIINTQWESVDPLPVKTLSETSYIAIPQSTKLITSATSTPIHPIIRVDELSDSDNPGKVIVISVVPIIMLVLGITVAKFFRNR